MPATATTPRPARDVLTEGIAKVGGWSNPLCIRNMIGWGSSKAGITVEFDGDGMFALAVLSTGLTEETTTDVAQLLLWFATYGD